MCDILRKTCTKSMDNSENFFNLIIANVLKVIFLESLDFPYINTKYKYKKIKMEIIKNNKN